MIKLFKLIFILLFFFSNNLFSKEIEIIGNQRISDETIILLSGIDENIELNNTNLNLILKRLYDTNFFEDVSLDFNKTKLTVNVKEYPIIENIQISGIKKKPLIELIKNNINIKEKGPFNFNKVEDEKKKINLLLSQIGYYFSTVDIISKKNKENIDIEFQIQLGQKSFIKKIIFSGDKIFKSKKLAEVITSEESKFWKFLSNKKFLNIERIELDKRLLTNFYKNYGYYDIQILSNTAQYNDSGFILTYNIDAGEKYTFDKLTLSLPSNYDVEKFKKLSDNLKYYEGKIYSLNIIADIISDIENVASSNQYDFVDARVTENISKNNSISLNLEIIDSTKFFVNRINIYGNSITQENVIRNQLLVDEGDPLNNLLLNKSIANIKSLRIFKNVNSEILETSDTSKKNININIEEMPTGEISLGAGVGTSGASSVFGIKENNFLGKGVVLNTNLSIGEDSIKGIFDANIRNYKNSSNDLNISIQSQEIDRFTDFGYKSNLSKVELGTNYEIYDKLFFSPSLVVSNEKLSTSNTASNLLQKQEGSYQDLLLSYGFFYDKRNQSFNTSSGYFSNFNQILPLNISDNQTLISSYQFKIFDEYISNIVGSASINLKAAHSFGDDDVRISNRLYIPQRLLKGFQSGKVGPKDGDDFIGGNYLASLNLVSDLPVLNTLDTVDFNIFFDAANTWGVDYDSSLNDSSFVRSSLGIGADWFTPIGPVTITVAQPITKKESDKTETFTFNIGTSF